jgi:hypothetical protein
MKDFCKAVIWTAVVFIMGWGTRFIPAFDTKPSPSLDTSTKQRLSIIEFNQKILAVEIQKNKGQITNLRYRDV